MSLVALLLGACNDPSSSSSTAAQSTVNFAPRLPSPSHGAVVRASNAGPVITGSAPATITVGQGYRFQPQASDPGGHALTFAIENKPPWAAFDGATGLLAGTPGAADIGTDANVVISVSDGAKSASLPAFSITVAGASAPAAVTLSWQPPTQYTNGAPLTDLAGYHIHYGTQTQNYTQTIELANPGVTSYAVQSLAPGTYYFAVTAYDSTGSESDYSGEATATVN